MLFPPSLPPMWGRCNLSGLKYTCFFILVVVSGIQGCWSLNAEGFALLKFRARVYYDPYGALQSWNPNDANPCKWSGIHCIDEEVQVLDLSRLSLEGTLAPELGELSQLRALILNKNHFSGAIPTEIGNLTNLELLDLRVNNLSGPVPTELGGIKCLKRLLISDNNFEGSIPKELGKLNFLSEFEYDDILTSTFGCINRKFGRCTWRNSLKQKEDSIIIPFKEAFKGYSNALPLIRLHAIENSDQSNLPSSWQPRMVQDVHNLLDTARRKLVDQSANLAAAPAPASAEAPSIQIITISSGSFPAAPNGKSLPNSPPPTAQNTSTDSAYRGSLKWKYIWLAFFLLVLLIIVAATILLFCRRKSKKDRYTGLSGQLQRALTKGIPKINRVELETACEDFSNIIDTLEGCTVYKGTLTSGVEIAVASATILSSKEWSENAEILYREKIDRLSRVNHKNFVNLIGFCEDREPFSRMMVFEYAPNGSLFEHLHVEEMEHLDWSARTRIIMGIAYCLQYMHHDLNPPVVHPNLSSYAILLTDDYAAKVADINFGPDSSSKVKKSSEEKPENFKLPPADIETNVYGFGVLLLEIISGKLPYSKEQGDLVNWAAGYLNDKRGISYLIDPSLESFKDNELDVVCDVIHECIQADPNLRPNMKDVTSKLRQGIGISPEQATPRLSPLWWAELEILSAEAT